MLHLVDNKTKKAVRSPRTQTLNPDGLITSSSKSSNSFSAYNLPQSDTVVNTHSMVNMKKSLLPKDRQKSPPTRPAPPQGRGQCDGGTICRCPHRVKSGLGLPLCMRVYAPQGPPKKPANTHPTPPQGRGQCDGGTVCGFPHRVKSEVKPVACIKVCAPRSPPNKKDACRRLFLLVDPKGFEPSASAMRTRRSPN